MPLVAQILVFYLSISSFLKEVKIATQNSEGLLWCIICELEHKTWFHDIQLQKRGVWKDRSRLAASFVSSTLNKYIIVMCCFRDLILWKQNQQNQYKAICRLHQTCGKLPVIVQYYKILGLSYFSGQHSAINL